VLRLMEDDLHPVAVPLRLHGLDVKPVLPAPRR
jgi:hypothetical protein